MIDNKDKAKLGEGILDELKVNVNQEMLEWGKLFLGIISQYVKGKIQGINLDELFSKKDEEELLNLWSTQLAEKGIIPKGYAGLPENLLIDNLHQDGYLDGMYIGYLLAMMSLADNNASKDLILTIRDDIRPNLMGYHYNNRDEFINKFKEKYGWINDLKKTDILEK